MHYYKTPKSVHGIDFRKYPLLPHHYSAATGSETSGSTLAMGSGARPTLCLRRGGAAEKLATEYYKIQSSESSG